MFLTAKSSVIKEASSHMCLQVHCIILTLRGVEGRRVELWIVRSDEYVSKCRMNMTVLMSYMYCSVDWSVVKDSVHIDIYND